MSGTRVILALALALSACGGEVTKSGAPANSGANSAPGLNSSVGGGGGGGGSAQGREQGSSQSVVTDAYRRIWPLMCQFDATCPEPTFQEACDVQVPPDAQIDQCWIVDSALLSQCEQALMGLQCEEDFRNLPVSCATALRECQCLGGYVEVWTDEGEQECAEPCVDNACNGELACYNGACVPREEDRCADNEGNAYVDGEFVCAEYCDGDATCDGELVCSDGYCVPAPPAEDM